MAALRKADWNLELLLPKLDNGQGYPQGIAMAEGKAGTVCVQPL